MVVMKNSFNYLRTHRLTWALRQKEVAYLLGFKSASSVGKWECSERMPPMRALLAYEVLFSQAAQELYPALYAQTEQEVGERVSHLVRELDGKSDAWSQRKLKLFARMDAGER
jgi:transcriptional regulator with XRE-family HTH domain